jgi:glycosyltransferase involved in cell wall biosynthesis
VTTERRRQWLSNRRWLPRRPVEFVPIPSNLPATDDDDDDPRGVVIGVIGFASPDAAIPLVADAVRLLRERCRELQLVFVGAPGTDGLASDRWLGVLEASGCSDIAEFNGVRDLQALARDLKRSDIVVLPDCNGPESRRGMIAAALAAGKVVVALDGPETWDLLRRQRGVVLLPEDPEAFASELLRFIADKQARRDQEARAVEFYNRSLAPDVVAGRLSEIIGFTRNGLAR